MKTHRYRTSGSFYLEFAVNAVAMLAYLAILSFPLPFVPEILSAGYSLIHFSSSHKR